MKISIFIFILFVGCYFMEMVLVDKSVEAVSKEYNKYANDKIDVAFFGSSVMKNGIYPMFLYEDYGISSYNFASGNQSLASSYYLMKQIIREQSPEVIVLDCLYAAYDDKYLNDVAVHYVSDMMSFPEKYEMISEFVSLKDSGEYLFPLLKYHSRWNSLSGDDFQYTENYAYGAKVHYASAPMQNFSVTKESLDLPILSEKYLMDIINLCKSEEVDLVLITLPIYFDFETSVFGNMKECQKYYNRVEEIAKENGIQCLNFMHLATEVGINYQIDFADRLHLNAYGATKMTQYIGKILTESFSLPDVRYNDEYSYMKEDYQKFMKYYNQLTLTAQRNIIDYFNVLSEIEDYTAILSVRDIQGYYLTPEITESMKIAGFSLADDLLEREYHGYIGIVSNNKSIYESVSSNHDALHLSGNVLNKEVSVDSQTLLGGNLSSIKLDGIEYSKNWRGFNIVVICNETGEIVDSVCFDTHVPEFTCYR